jgi:cytoplasmic iron level regulating protein YaaA (DUF328/UPF0246 family)
VLILLPPSEGKASTEDGRPFAIADLSMPGLHPTRERVRTALVTLCTGRENRARDVLGISARQVDELNRNRDLLGARALPASEVYTGVLFAALDHASLPAVARRRLHRWVLVSSALWGAVRLDDRIPAYRLSGDVALPRLGPVSTLWRKPLASAMSAAAEGGVVLDLRSGTYAKMWTPDAAVAPSTVTARVLQRRADGSRAVVSHHNKATKGRLVRSLAEHGATPKSVPALASLMAELGYETELHEHRAGKPWTMDVVVDEL